MQIDYCHIYVPWTWTLLWRHNERDGASNHQLPDCLLNRLFRRRWKITSKLCVTGLCARNSPVIGEFPVQMASNWDNVYNWWRCHDKVEMWYSLSLPSDRDKVWFALGRYGTSSETRPFILVTVFVRNTIQAHCATCVINLPRCHSYQLYYCYQPSVHDASHNKHGWV